MSDVYILSGVRTAIGDFGGSLKDHSPAELGAKVIAEAISRAGIVAQDVEHVVMGQVIPTVPKDAYLARVAAVKAGIPVEAAALTLNRLCGSGVQAIVSAAQMIMLGECDIAAAGGAEVMSRSPHVASSVRFGQKMGPVSLTDAMVEVLSDPFEDFHMGITAENVAVRYGITRTMQDGLACASHARAARAQAEGRFDAQILPIEVRRGRATAWFAADEHVKAETSIEVLAKLRPAFKTDGSVTAGNASGVNDAAAAVVLASERAVRSRSLRPLARVVSWGYAGVDPAYMGIGPVSAVPIALKRAGIALDDVEVIESNEAFAAQACAVVQELGIDPDRVNPNGSGISLGHPVGATGTILAIKAAFELQRIGGRYGLITMCIGGGQGIALVIERTL